MSSPSSASSLTDTEMQDASASTANQSSSQSQQQHFGTYSEQVSKRRALYNDVKPISLASTTFEPLLAVPHGCSVNTIAITPCSTHFFTGGADGLVRRFALIDSLNGRAVENLMVSGRPTSLNPSQSITNYIGDIPSSKPQAQVILSGYWESGSEPEEPNAAPIENGGDPSATTKFGPRGAGLGSVASPVHSIAVQDEEIFALVGTEDGNIGLHTVRLDEGRLRHSFSPAKDSKQAHLPKPISALSLDADQKGFVSGGWDGKIMQWDLNTGSLSRSYPAGNQIASLAFRPTGNSYTPSLPATPQENDRDSSTEADAVGEEDSDPDDIAAALKPQVTSVDGTVSLPPTPSPLRKFADALNPSLPELSQDVLLCSSFDGQVTLYDRRAKEAAMRKFGMDKITAPWAMQACWSPCGNAVYVGRRNATVEAFDLRSASRRARQTLHFPASSGPVTAVQAFPDNRHIVCGSADNVRLLDLDWDTQPKESRRPVPYRIVPGFSSGTVSSLAMNPNGQFLLAAAGDRKMVESTEQGQDGVVVHAIG